MTVAETAEVTRWRVPLLSGWVLIAFRVLWICAALLTIASLASSYRQEQQQRDIVRGVRDFGLANQQFDELHPLKVKASGPDAEADLPDFEILKAVDGRRLPNTSAGRAALLAGPPESAATLTFIRADGSEHALRLHRDQRYLQHYYAGSGLSFEGRRLAQYLFFLSGAAMLCGIGTILFVRRGRDPVAALIAMGSMLCFIDLDIVLGPGATIASGVCSQIGNCLIALGLLIFPDGRIRTRTTWWAMSLVILGFTLLIAMSVLNLPALQPFYFAVIGIAVATSVVAIVRTYRATPTGSGKQQIKIGIFGFAIAMIVFGISQLIEWPIESLGDAQRPIILWLLLIQSALYALCDAVLAVSLFFSLLRYRLYDAESTISRSVAYGALTLILLAVFAGAEKMIEEVGKEYLGHELGALAAGLGAALAAILVTPLHHRITHWAERRFQGGLVRLRHGLPILLGDMRETAAPAELADAMLMRVEAGVRAIHGAVVVRGAVLDVRDVALEAVRAWLAEGRAPIDQVNTLHCDREDALFPMRVPLHATHIGLVGWLLLGPRPDGSFYGKDEREVLSAIAEPAARALAIAIERQRREDARDGEMGALRQLVIGLQARIERLFGEQGATA